MAAAAAAVLTCLSHHILQELYNSQQTHGNPATAITTHFTHAHIHIISPCTHVNGVHATSVSKQIFFPFIISYHTKGRRRSVPHVSIVMHVLYSRTAAYWY